MKNNKIQIELQLTDNRKYCLILTPENYKEEFKLFIRENNISPDHAYYIKNLVQAKMIHLYRGYLEQQKKKAIHQLQHTVNQSWHEPKQSPKFGKISQQKETQTLQIEQKQEPQQKFFKKKDKQSIESLFSTNMHSTMANTPAKMHKQIEDKQWLNNESMFRQQEQQNQVLTHKHHRQLSSPCMTSMNIKKHQIQQQTPSTKHKTNMKKSKLMHQSFNRLHHASTQSFKNKKNEDLNHKEHEDYLQVEKYMMNQNLKRTTHQFFNHLYTSKTESFSAKHRKQQEVNQEFEQQRSPKKVSLSKSFKGSNWTSGSRCELKFYLEQQRKIEDQLKKKQLSIKKRVKQEKLHPKSKEKLFKSRVCQKCDPKSPIKTQKFSPSVKKMPEPIKTAPRPYISNLLMESYKQFTKELSQF